MVYAKIKEEDRGKVEEELKKAQDKKWYRRVKIVMLSAEGYGVPQLSELFDLNPHTVRSYIKRYNQGGLEGLQRQYYEGPAPKVPQSKEYWEEVLRRSPCQFEILATGARNWTQALVVEYCHHILGVEMTQGGISGLFSKLGIRWNRSRLKVTSPDPLYQVKRQRISDLKKKPALGI